MRMHTNSAQGVDHDAKTSVRYAACHSFIRDWLITYGSHCIWGKERPIITSLAAQRYAAHPRSQEASFLLRHQLEWRKRCLYYSDLSMRKEIENQIVLVTHLMRAVRAHTRACADCVNDWLVQTHSVTTMNTASDEPPSPSQVHDIAAALLQKIDHDDAQPSTETENTYPVSVELVTRYSLLKRVVALAEEAEGWARSSFRLRRAKGRCLLLETLQTVELWSLVAENLDGASAAALLQTCRFEEKDVETLLRHRMPHVHIFVCPGMFPHDVATSTQRGAPQDAQVRTNRQLRIAVGLVAGNSRDAIREAAEVEDSFGAHDYLTVRDPAFDVSETSVVHVNAASRKETFVSPLSVQGGRSGWNTAAVVPDARRRLQSVDPARYFVRPPTLAFKLVHADTREAVDPRDPDGCLHPSAETSEKFPRLSRPIFRFRNEYVCGDCDNKTCTTARDVMVESQRESKTYYKEDGYRRPTMFNREDATLLKEVPPGPQWPIAATTTSFWTRDYDGRAPSGRFRVRVQMMGESGAGRQVRLVSYSEPVHFVSSRRAGQRRKDGVARGEGGGGEGGG